MARSGEQRIDGRGEGVALPLLCALALSFTVGVYVPVDTYFTLASEVCFSFVELLPECLLLFAATFAVSFGLSALLRGWARHTLCALMLGGAVALYMQGNILNLDYGSLNGWVIDWDQYGNYGRVNFVYWMLMILAPVALLVALRKRFVRALRFASALLIAFLGISLALQALTGAGAHQDSEYSFTTDGQFELSKSDNALIFVLDTMDASTLTDYLAARPELAARMDGFTHFPNTVGSSVVTQFGLPVLISGRAYGYEQPYDAYIRDTWGGAELFAALKARGWRNYVYTELGFANAEAAQWVDNTVSQPMLVADHAGLVRDVGALAAFRYAPHALKKRISVNGERIQGNKRGADEEVYVLGYKPFFRGVKDQKLAATLDAPAMHFYHMSGMHLPYGLGSDGEPSDDATLYTVMDAYFGMLDDCFAQLKALGLYDDATIVITSDHGNTQINQHFALMIKRPSKRGAVARNDALVAQEDVVKTVAAALGFGGEVTVGCDAYLGEREEAEFRNYFWSLGDRFFQCRCWLDGEGLMSVDETGLVYTPQGLQQYEYPLYEPGEKVVFSSLDIAQGWFAKLSYSSMQRNASEQFGVWLGKPDMQLKLRLKEKGAGALRLTLGISGVVGEKQRLHVMSDGETLAEAVIREGDAEVALLLPERLREQDVLSLTLRFPDATSQLERSGGTAGSIRRQAVSIASFVIE